MDLLGLISQHGYLVTVSVLFFTALGLPLPASAVLLAVGAAARTGVVSFGAILLLAWCASVSGDLLLFFGGRFTGWWLLSSLCRVSLDPEACIFSTADYFYKRGPNTLLFAKFVPGLGAMAGPIAGSLNMRLWKFLKMDALGTLAYCFAWTANGYLFSRFIVKIVAWMGRASHTVLAAVLLIAAVYAAALLVLTLRSRRYKQIEKISAASLHERLQDLTPDKLVVIADVRSHGYYDPGMYRIKNSIRVEPHRLKEELVALREFMAPECEIYLYCSCIRDTTSVRVAYSLGLENCRTQVIEGGMKAWVKAGGALELVPEADLRKLPKFD